MGSSYPFIQRRLIKSRMALIFPATAMAANDPKQSIMNNKTRRSGSFALLR
jgi:hypothetical protein